jgi:DNA-binding transcriptional LysR family regulator
MEFRQLKYFLMLAEELHFKRAAEKLCIVQPALTKQIQDLEAELGVKLFDRNKRNVRISVAGEFFKAEISQIFERLERAKNEIKQVEVGKKGEIRIGYVGSCIHTFLPDLLKKLNAIYPEIHTYLSEMTTASQLLAIQKGELDVAFLRNPPVSTLLENKLVFSENFALVLPVNHVLNEKKLKSLQQVSDEKFILPTKSDGETYHQLLWGICETSGFTPQIAHETVHGHTSLKSASNLAIKFIELKNIPQKAEITATWNAKNLNPSLKHFLSLLD